MRHLLCLIVAIIGSVGCLVASDPEGTVPSPTAPPPSYEPRPGCKRTACDVDADKCRQDAQASCIQCKVDCGAIQIEYQSQCIAACARLCSSNDQTAKTCDVGAKSCHATSPRNAFCADGVTDSCVPSPSSASQLPSSVSGHRGLCSDAEIASYVDACQSATSTSSTCRAFISTHRACNSCAYGSTGSEAIWIPNNGKQPWLNRGLCVAIRGAVPCGRAIFAADSCAANACSACEDTGECAGAASDLSCADLAAAAQECVSELPVAVLSDCALGADKPDSSALVKTMVALVCGQ
jgi:hypothetical protein